MARIPSGAVVTGLTAAALAVIGVLAWQASAAPDHLRHGAGATAAVSSPAPTPTPQPTVLPAGSGSGQRIVYALGGRRVWLVDATGRGERTFTVMPGTVSPPPGRYTVTSRSAKVMGSDGVPVEHVVIFAHVNGVYVGFSAAVDGSTPTPDPARKTGGVREARADGAAMWSFAEPGAPVVVTP